VGGVVRASVRGALCLALALGLVGTSAKLRAEPPVTKEAWRVDGVAAVVGGVAPGPGTIAIYRSDVELRARLALLRAGAEAAALGPLPSSLLRASLEEVIGEALIASESARLSLAQPSADDVRRERERLALSVGGEAKLKRLVSALAVPESELRAIAERRAVVSAFLTANLEGTLEVTPLELEKAYAEQAHPFGSESFEAVRDQLRAWLVQRRVEAAVARWVESLKQRTPMRRLVTF
jgi:hypothetical protein